jgi:hypothetical protein
MTNGVVGLLQRVACVVLAGLGFPQSVKMTNGVVRLLQ